MRPESPLASKLTRLERTPMPSGREPVRPESSGDQVRISQIVVVTLITLIQTCVLGDIQILKEGPCPPAGRKRAS